VAGFSVLWRVLGMKAGQSKSMRVLGIVGIYALRVLGIVGILALRILGIVGIVAFIGFCMMRYEIFVAIWNNPRDLLEYSTNDTSELTVYVILYLLNGGPLDGGWIYRLLN